MPFLTGTGSSRLVELYNYPLSVLIGESDEAEKTWVWGKGFSPSFNTTVH